jgi:hypothetical protein
MRAVRLTAPGPGRRARSPRAPASSNAPRAGPAARRVQHSGRPGNAGPVGRGGSADTSISTAISRLTAAAEAAARSFLQPSITIRGRSAAARCECHHMRPALPRRGQHPSPKLLKRLSETQRTGAGVRHVDNNPYADVCTIDCKLAMVVAALRGVGPGSRSVRQRIGTWDSCQWSDTNQNPTRTAAVRRHPAGLSPQVEFSRASRSTRLRISAETDRSMGP